MTHTTYICFDIIHSVVNHRSFSLVAHLSLLLLHWFGFRGFIGIAVIEKPAPLWMYEYFSECGLSFKFFSPVNMHCSGLKNTCEVWSLRGSRSVREPRIHGQCWWSAESHVRSLQAHIHRSWFGTWPTFLATDEDSSTNAPAAPGA